MSLGQGTQVVDGQRNLFPTGYAFFPTQYGPQTTGVPQVSPTQPPFIGQANTAPGAMEGVGGYGTAGNNAYTTQVAAENPFHWKVSPVPWAIGMLVLGLVLLKGVSWRETLEEKGPILGGSESAKAEV